METQKQRHGCLTAYLIFMIVIGVLTAVTYVLGKSALQQMYAEAQMPALPDWVFIVLPAMAIFNVVCAIALFKWKKWGFYGFVISGLVAFGINMSLGLGLATSVLGLAGLAILYGVLQIGEGGKNKGWPQLD